MKRRILSLLLAVVLILSSLPTAASAAQTAPVISESSISLTGILSINFKIAPGTETDMSGYSVHARIGNDTREQIIQTPTKEGGLYVYTAALPAHRMEETVSVRLMKGEEQVDGGTWTVAKYVAALQKQDPNNGALKKLTDSILTYGSYAAAYDREETIPTNDVISVTPEMLKDFGKTVTKAEKSLNMGISVYLDDACDLRIKFNKTAFDGATLLIDGAAVDSNRFTTEGDRWVYSIPELLPQDWENRYHIQIVKGDVTLADLNYGVMSYAYTELSKGQETKTGLQSLMKAMYLYNRAADSYNDSSILRFALRGGASNYIQVNTNLPVSTPLVSFTADQNGCSIDQTGNQHQWFGWAGMDNAAGTIVLTFHFNANFSAGQTYVLPAGAVFGFTDGNKYTLDKNYTFTFDGTNWTMDAVFPELPEEPDNSVLSFQYRYGAANVIQVNTNLPVSTPLVNFTAAENGCDIDQSGNQYQQVGWIQMAIPENESKIVLTFHFGGNFTAGQTYVLPAGAVFGFTDGTRYTLDKNYIFTFNGTDWTMEATDPPAKLELQYVSGTQRNIQFSTNLPADTECKDFLATHSGFSLLQSGDQQLGYAHMFRSDDGTVQLDFIFNNDFAKRQSYTLGAGSGFLFGGKSYTLENAITLYWDGAAWVDALPVQTTVELTYSSGNSQAIVYHTDLPTDTPRADFLSDQNKCSLIQSGQGVGWIEMNKDATAPVVLTFHFNNAFTAGQSYTLGAGSVFGFTDGKTYTLEQDITLYWVDNAWVDTKPVDVLDASNFTGGKDIITFADLPVDASDPEKIEEYKALGFNTSLLTEDYTNAQGPDENYQVTLETADAVQQPETPAVEGNVLSFSGVHYGIANQFMIKTNLTDAAYCDNFVATEDILQGGDKTVGWFATNSFSAEAGTKLITAVFTSDFTAGQTYTLGKGSKFVLGDGTYILDGDYTFTYNGSGWTMTAVKEDKVLSFKGFHYGTSSQILIDSNLTDAANCSNATITDIIQSGDHTLQNFSLHNLNGVSGKKIVTLMFSDLSPFTAGQSYTLEEGSKFVLGDGTYVLDKTYTFTYNGGESWTMDSGALNLTLNSAGAKYIQLKTNIPTGLTYGDFLLGDATKGHNVILETTEGAQAVAWFGYSADANTNAVYLTFNFSGCNKPGTQYILKAGTMLKAGDKEYITDRDYILTVQNKYLTSLQNLDDAGLDVWIRNYSNTSEYFTADLTSTLKLYENTIDGFYVVDEMFQTEALMTASGQTATSNFTAMETVRDWFNTNFADKYFHANHVPITSYDHYTTKDGATLKDFSTEGYANFLKEYKQTFNDQLTNASGASVSFDNYPFVRQQGEYSNSSWSWITGKTFESGIESSYLVNCLIAANVAAEDDFGLCIQTFKAPDLVWKNSGRDITSASEVSLQLYTGMAMGADLFEYFAYGSNADFPGILNQDGSKRIYDLVKEGNKVLCFADVVNTFTWNGIVTSSGSANHHNGVGFDYVNGMTLSNDSDGVLSSYSSTDDAIIGCFTKGELNGYMAVNFNDPQAVTGNNQVTLTFDGCTRARVYTCVDGALTSEVVQLTDGACTVTLAPGSGCFVIPA